MLQRLAVSTVTAFLVVIAACSTPQPAQNPPDTGGPKVEQSASESGPPPSSTEQSAAPAYPASKPSPESWGLNDRAADAAVMAPPEPAYSSGSAKMAAQAMFPPELRYRLPPEDREAYAHFDANPIHRAADEPVSTFSIDVDTGAYANVRRFLNEGRLPPQDAVRVEEMINYFDYAYAPPRDKNTPFSTITEIAPTPWNPKTYLLHIGIQGWKPQGTLPPSNLVFLVDVSGSMDEPDKLPLVKKSLELLTRQLGSQDRISLVVYAGASGVVLEPTPGSQSAKILAALGQLDAGGSTNGGEGIERAYQLAEQAFIKNGINRVLLATDGDFNVGVTDFQQLLDLIKEKRKSGIALTTLGFGTGNYNDRLMEQLADAGNGNYAYIDTLKEAQKVLVEQRAATLDTIARDVKIQVEFNPAVVAEYRLIGYENRLLRREDFNNDKVDAGEIGAGHTVTALYEVALAGSGGEQMEPLRYGERKPAVGRGGDELAFLRLRYKRPEDGMDAASRLIEQPVLKRDILAGAAKAGPSFRLAAAVAAFGQLLRGGVYTHHYGYQDVLALARSAQSVDTGGYTGEFLQLVKLADSLSAKQARNEAQPEE